MYLSNSLNKNHYFFKKTNITQRINMRNKYLKVLIHKANIEKVQCDPYNIDVYCSNEVRSYGKSCERLVKIIQLTHEKIL